MTEQRKPKRGYWYEYDEAYCPLCAWTVVEKHRVYDRPKPKHWHQRHIMWEVACSGHFM